MAPLFIGIVIYLVLFLGVGISLFRRYRETGVLPARTLAFSYLTAVVFTVIGGANLAILNAEPALYGTLYPRIMRAIGLLLFSGGIWLLGLFTRQVFRPRARWAAGLLAVVAGLFVYANIVFFPLPHWYGLPTEGPLSMALPFLAACSIVNLWLSGEAFLQWRILRKERRAAIADGESGVFVDRFVIHRFGLVVIAGVSYLAITVTIPDMVVRVLPSQHEAWNRYLTHKVEWGATVATLSPEAGRAKYQELLESVPEFARWVILVDLVFIVVFSLCTWLAWAPPDRYKTWIRRRGA